MFVFDDRNHPSPDLSQFVLIVQKGVWKVLQDFAPKKYIKTYKRLQKLYKTIRKPIKPYISFCLGLSIHNDLPNPQADCPLIEVSEAMQP